MLIVAEKCLSLKLRQLRCKNYFSYKYMVNFHVEKKYS